MRYEIMRSHRNKSHENQWFSGLSEFQRNSASFWDSRKKKFFSRKEVKELLGKMKEQWGFEEDLEYIFMASNKDRLYIANREVFDVSLDKLRVNSIGIYFGELQKGELRLSVEGSQIIGKKAGRNVAELNESQLKAWFKGNDIDVEGNYSGFVLIKHGDDFIGTGKFKEGKILNYLPKTRRLAAEI